MDALIRKVLDVFRINYKDDSVSLVNEKYNSFPISPNNFHSIEKVESSRKLIFVDGGNAELFNSGNCCVHKLRVYASVFDINNNRVHSERREFYVLAYAVGNHNISYNVVSFPNFLGFKIDSLNKELMEGNNRIHISRMVDVFRRFSELKIATELCEKFEHSVVVLDGTLKSNFPGETKFLEELYKTGLEKDCVISALSKTSSLLTKKGYSLNYLLMRISPMDEWYYYPIAKISDNKHLAEISVVKLNKNSKYAFRFEIFNKQASFLNEVLWLLKNNSSDVCFPGYPYGLIDADRFARVSNEEKNTLKTLFLSKLPKDVVLGLSVSDAHDILNKIIK